jgi:hypothetical protein
MFVLDYTGLTGEPEAALLSPAVPECFRAAVCTAAAGYSRS